MIVLGIEGSANKLGVGIIKNEEILCNFRKTYCPPNGEGFIPVKAAEHHKLAILDLIEESLKTCTLKLSEIDAFAYTRGPGIQQSLVVVATVVRTLSLLYNKPIIPVNHCIAHIEMGRLVTNAINPVILYVSGGNTQIIAYSDQRYKIFGETLDIAVGNCLDKLARDLNLDNYPSPGLSIEKMARKGKKYIDLPYCVKGMDMSFSGVLSSTKRIIETKLKNNKVDTLNDTKGIVSIDDIKGSNMKDKNFNNNIKEEALVHIVDKNKNKTFENDFDNLHKITVEDICFSVQETIFSMLVEGTERCMSFVGSKEVLIVGGVGCNLRLQEMMGIMAKERGSILYSTDERYCIDNGAMIAYTGYLMYKSGLRFDIKDCDVTQRFRTDSVKVTWRD